MLGTRGSAFFPWYHPSWRDPCPGPPTLAPYRGAAPRLLRKFPSCARRLRGEFVLRASRLAPSAGSLGDAGGTTAPLLRPFRMILEMIIASGGECCQGSAVTRRQSGAATRLKVVEFSMKRRHGMSPKTLREWVRQDRDEVSGRQNKF